MCIYNMCIYIYVNYSYIYICISMIKTFIVCDWCFVLSHESIGTSRYTHEKKIMELGLSPKPGWVMRF